MPRMPETSDSDYTAITPDLRERRQRRGRRTAETIDQERLRSIGNDRSWIRNEAWRAPTPVVFNANYSFVRVLSHVTHTATSMSDYGGRYVSARSSDGNYEWDATVGDVILACYHHRRMAEEMRLYVALPDSLTYHVNTGKIMRETGWHRLMRPIARSWLAMLPIHRIVRACIEGTTEIDAAVALSSDMSRDDTAALRNARAHLQEILAEALRAPEDSFERLIQMQFEDLRHRLMYMTGQNREFIMSALQSHYNRDFPSRSRAMDDIRDMLRNCEIDGVAGNLTRRVRHDANDCRALVLMLEGCLGVVQAEHRRQAWVEDIITRLDGWPHTTGGVNNLVADMDLYDVLDAANGLIQSEEFVAISRDGTLQRQENPDVDEALGAVRRVLADRYGLDRSRSQIRAALQDVFDERGGDAEEPQGPVTSERRPRGVRLDRRDDGD